MKMSIAILQMDDMMVKTALPKDQESTEWGNYDEMQLQDRMEQKQGQNALEQ